MCEQHARLRKANICSILGWNRTSEVKVGEDQPPPSPYQSTVTLPPTINQARLTRDNDIVEDMLKHFILFLEYLLFEFAI